MALHLQSENFEKLNLILESEAQDGSNIKSYLQSNKGKYIYHLSTNSMEEDNDGVDERLRSKIDRITTNLSDLNKKFDLFIKCHIQL